MPRTAASGPTFLVGRNARGQWIARDTEGLIEGIFVSCREAVHFATLETNGRPGAVILSSWVVDREFKR